MNDNELLELSAKAAGYDFAFGKEWHDKGRPQVKGNYWNPLEDDGDVFRLAVDLRQNIDLDCFEPVCVFDSNFKNGVTYVSEPLKDNDHYAATRRAIVRAAAEIGKAMP